MDIEIKCDNFEICETMLPYWWYDNKNNYLCTNCHFLYGKEKLQITDDNEKCIMCLEKKIRGIVHPKCGHSICVDCFKMYYYSEYIEEPQFPYPEIEDEYYGDPENKKWKNKYPTIKLFYADWNYWNNNKRENYLNECNTIICPLCKNIK